MGRRRPAILSIATAVMLITATVAVAADPVHVSVRPRVGTPTARFVVSFKAPASTGRDGSMLRAYRVNATGSDAVGCASDATVPVGDVGAGQEVRVTLDPPHPWDAWCIGKFAGRVEETLSPVCGFREACPGDGTVVTIGRFSFHVRGASAARG